MNLFVKIILTKQKMELIKLRVDNSQDLYGVFC